MQAKRYPALLLDESLADGRLSGEVFVSAGKITFLNVSIEKSIGVSQAFIEYGGTANRHIFFKSKDTHFTISSLDSAILNEEGLKTNPNLKPKINAIKSKKRFWYLGLSIAGMLFLAPIIAFLVFRKQIIHTIAKKVPSSVEQTMGESYIKQVSLMEKLDSNSLSVNMLREKAKLISAQTNGETQFKIYISDSDQINAYALPGGYVVFNKGLLVKAKSWEEVLGVMGHEMAHVTEKHHARGIVSSIGWVSVASIFLGDGSAITNLLLGAGSQLEQLSYSRDFETEADEKGYEYLKKAKIHPKGLISFFETLKEESGAAKHIPELISTHPSSDNRAKNLQTKLDNEKENTYLELGDYQEFIKLIKK
jgi:beta-barrel assembly-enhancing protease